MKLEYYVALVVVAVIVTYRYRKEIALFAELAFTTKGKSIAELEWRKEAILHASFYGSALAAFMGFQHESIWTQVIAGIWFVLGLWYSWKLAAIVTEREKHEEMVSHRRMAGTVRSIVASEIKASKTKKLEVSES